MRKILVVATLALLSITNLSAQKNTPFEGIVTYSISFEGSGLPQEALSMLNGAELVSYIKGDKRRTDMNMAIQSTTSIIDEKNQEVVTLMDIMGQKYLIRTKSDELKKEQEDGPELSIKYVDGTKDIAGYKCKKAEITVKGKDGKEEMVTIYYTEEIPTSDIKSVYKGLKGYPMEYQITQGGIKMTFTAKSVSKDPVPDNKFELPKDGYKEMTMEEFQKTMLQMGQ
ncbi:MAG: hypothetical protein JWP12_3052 [Bacteroidetes bacterium]|nr:hypothetical protein [Bacteroidota bacterium]